MESAALIEKLRKALEARAPRWRLHEILSCLEFQCEEWCDLPDSFKRGLGLLHKDTGIDGARTDMSCCIQAKSRSRGGKVTWPEIAKFLASGKTGEKRFARAVLVLDGWPSVSKVRGSLYEVAHVTRGQYFIDLARGLTPERVRAQQTAVIKKQAFKSSPEMQLNYQQRRRIPQKPAKLQEVSTLAHSAPLPEAAQTASQASCTSCANDQLKEDRSPTSCAVVSAPDGNPVFRGMSPLRAAPHTSHPFRPEGPPEREPECNPPPYPPPEPSESALVDIQRVEAAKCKEEPDFSLSGMLRDSPLVVKGSIVSGTIYVAVEGAGQHLVKIDFGETPK